MKIASPAECEEADYVICVRFGTPTPFRDNVLDVCCACGQPIIHRPYVPRHPPKICVQCAAAKIDSHADS